jgi:anti-sigma regulatory factor (Ser/Thr protein kinase)
VLRRNSFRLPGHTASVGVARRRLRDHLADWGHGPDDPAPADAVLLVSEPATNVVRHGPLSARETEEVSDEGRPEPRLRVVGAWEETGTARPCGPW